MKISLARKNALIEALKMLARIYVFGAFPVIYDGFKNGQIRWELVHFTGVIAVLKATDEYLHQYNKLLPAKKRSSGLFGVKGLTGF